MELKHADEYVKLISHEVKYHAVLTGVVVSVILALASSIVLVALFRVKSLIDIAVYVVSIVVLPVNILNYILARRSARVAEKTARDFAKAVEDVARLLNTQRVELLEMPPPPYIAVIKRDKYYIVLAYYGVEGVHVMLLEPFKVRQEEGYTAIFMRRSSELLATESIGDNVVVKVSKITAILPEPLEDFTNEGVFYAYEFYLPHLSVSSIVAGIEKVFELIRGLRNGSARNSRTR